MDRWSIPRHATLRRNAAAAQEKCSPTASALVEAICVVNASLNTLKRPPSTLKATSRFTVDCNFFCDCLCSQIECHMCIFSVETHIPLESCRRDLQGCMSTFSDALGVLYLSPLEKTVNSPNRPV